MRKVSASYRHISLKILGEFPKVLERVSFVLGQQRSQFRIFMQTPVETLSLPSRSSTASFRLGRKEVVKPFTMPHALCVSLFQGGPVWRLPGEADYWLQKEGGSILGGEYGENNLGSDGKLNYLRTSLFGADSPRRLP